MPVPRQPRHTLQPAVHPRLLGRRQADQAEHRVREPAAVCERCRHVAGRGPGRHARRCVSRLWPVWRHVAYQGTGAAQVPANC